MANASTIALPHLAITEGGVRLPLHPLLRTALRHWGLIPSEPNALEMLEKTSDSIPLIFLITDGAVEDERHIHNAVNRRSIYPRICTFGIGSYCNHYFLQMLAQIGRGYYDAAFDIVLYPDLIPDLSSGRPSIVSGRYNGNFPDSVKASGLLLDMSNFTVELEVQKSKGIPLDRVFARRQIDILTAHHAWLLENKQLEEKIKEVALQLRPLLSEKQLLVSVAEGVKLTDLQFMSLGAAAMEEDGELIAKLFGAIGKIWKADEKLFDAITGLSGSGPAYIYLAIEALADGGVAAGLPRELALGLASQTVLEAASMVSKGGKHLGQLKDDVASPGGTTIAGIYELEKGGFRGILMNAVVAATKHSQEFSRR
ncbi:unnamed protein product [Camellia sinensis]